ncbi:AAA-like domain-containing protein [Gloeothece verrucosa]|uniref:Serine/threonine kinase n=1 Tax=Gloeothece verrucosa (strain PCC 7822) TaxID=497965 RepID=E0UCX8_GLOV7|nr:AAA-like domain-containing protein [Gloeothece verrucosa]ADN16443.1 serine/threonine kinase [Gloeothece verrucosa PCC 7822]
MEKNLLLRSESEKITYEYQVGGSLPSNAPTYVIRKADRQLYQALKQGNFCYILNARQMGKSSLRVQVTKRLIEEGVRCAAVDLSMIGSQNITLAQWYTGLTYVLASELNLLEQISIRRWWKEHQSLSPAQRLGEFIEQVILKIIQENIVIFIDEIDSVLNLKFNLKDFLVLLTNFYHQRQVNKPLNRISFVLLGVANPSQFVASNKLDFFKISEKIELEGFKLGESQALMYGLKDKASNPNNVLKEILNWTNGQPFLTQKLCQIIEDSGATIPQNEEQKWIENLVKNEIIEQWETKDNPEHLKTIRDRLFTSPQVISLLKLYQQIEQQGEIKAIDSSEENELILSGLVIKEQEKLKVKNKIYQQIFNLHWIERNLTHWQSQGSRD